MSFSNALSKHNYEKTALTENGMVANATTSNDVLDFFTVAGTARSFGVKDIFHKALAQDVDLSLRALMWTRDIRGGAGQRKTFRDLLISIEEFNPEIASRIMHKIPEIGRWDDLLSYKEPINRKKAFEMISKALSERNALCAKWMPRKGEVAVELRKFMNLTPKQYRKLLVSLTNVVETKMCNKDWENIEFEKVPSVAHSRYAKAFTKNSKSYAEFLREIADGNTEKKVNAGAVYPYDVVRTLFLGNNVLADAMWKELPNYVGDNKILPIVDVSGSMGMLSSHGDVNPILAAVSLGLYLSDKNESDFKDIFITFSEESEAIKLSGTLTQKMNQMCDSKWGFNTNIHSAFEAILDIAIKGNVSTEDMPTHILILSDMQFDSCTIYEDTAIEMIKRKYESFGYEVPKIVFWNLAFRRVDNTPVKFNDSGVAMVSGFSPSIMKSILSDDIEKFTPYNVMIETLMSERYNY